jgi:phosphoserine phosphatase
VTLGNDWEATSNPAAMPANPDPRAAAFFDIDNTLIHGASMFHWARGLAKHNYLTKGQIADFVWKQARFVVVGKESASLRRPLLW